MSELRGNPQCTATRLAPGLYGVAIQNGAAGNAFLIAENHKRHWQVWNIKDLKPGTTRNSKLLAAWFAVAARGGCRNKFKDEDRLNCGPLYGQFGVLPNDDRGRTRFYLDGTYAQAAGLNVAAQLSIGTRLEGELLRVRVRDQYRTFSTCCDDEGRPMDWNLKLTPTGVEDLGYSPIPSPMESVDEVFYRTAKGMPAGDIAAPQVLAEARALVRQMPAQNGLPDMGTLMPPYPDFGDVGDVCIDFDEYGLAVSITQVNGKPYLRAMRRRTNCLSPPQAQK